MRYENTVPRCLGSRQCLVRSPPPLSAGDSHLSLSVVVGPNRDLPSTKFSTLGAASPDTPTPGRCPGRWGCCWPSPALVGSLHRTGPGATGWMVPWAPHAGRGPHQALPAHVSLRAPGEFFSFGDAVLKSQWQCELSLHLGGDGMEEASQAECGVQSAGGHSEGPHTHSAQGRRAGSTQAWKGTAGGAAPLRR